MWASRSWMTSEQLFVPHIRKDPHTHWSENGCASFFLSLFPFNFPTCYWIYFLIWMAAEGFITWICHKLLFYGLSCEILKLNHSFSHSKQSYVFVVLGILKLDSLHSSLTFSQPKPISKIYRELISWEQGSWNTKEDRSAKPCKSQPPLSPIPIGLSLRMQQMVPRHELFPKTLMKSTLDPEEPEVPRSQCPASWLPKDPGGNTSLSPSLRQTTVNILYRYLWGMEPQFPSEVTCSLQYPLLHVLLTSPSLTCGFLGSPPK